MSLRDLAGELGELLEREVRAIVRDELARAGRADARDLLTVPDAAVELGCTVAALRQRISRGHVPTRRIGSTVYISRSDLRAATKPGRGGGDGYAAGP